MTSMVMLDITIEVSVNIRTAFKRQAPSLAWALLLDTSSWHFRHFWKALQIGKLCSFGLWAKFTESKK